MPLGGAARVAPERSAGELIGVQGAGDKSLGGVLDVLVGDDGMGAQQGEGIGPVGVQRRLDDPHSHQDVGPACRGRVRPQRCCALRRRSEVLVQECDEDLLGHDEHG